jgi:hypothetical protein
VHIPESSANSAPDVFEQAMQLWSRGEPDAARRLLTDLIDRAGQLLATMSPPAPLTEGSSLPSNEENTADAEMAQPDPDLPPTSTPESRDRARRILRGADRALEKGNLQKAVNESHRAWSQAPDDEEIFARMVNTHVDAARALPGISGYDDARTWLLCARHHAKFNETVVAYFVDRTVEYARHEFERGRVDDARRLLEECMFYETSHSGVQELKAQIDAERRPTHPLD